MRKCFVPVLPVWNPSGDDIDAGDFARRCQDFEWSLLPKGVVFPLSGEIWEAQNDITIEQGPAKDGPDGQSSFEIVPIRAGERVRIISSEPGQLYILFMPVTAAVSGPEFIMPVARTMGVPCGESVYFTEAFRRLTQAE